MQRKKKEKRFWYLVIVAKEILYTENHKDLTENGHSNYIEEKHDRATEQHLRTVCNLTHLAVKSMGQGKD